MFVGIVLIYLQDSDASVGSESSDNDDDDDSADNTSDSMAYGRRKRCVARQ